jgi:hypothetical protein
LARRHRAKTPATITGSFFSIKGLRGKEKNMRKLNIILITAVAFASIVPCIALADKKKDDTPKESTTFNYGGVKNTYTNQSPAMKGSGGPTGGGGATKSGTRR